MIEIEKPVANGSNEPVKPVEQVALNRKSILSGFFWKFHKGGKRKPGGGPGMPRPGDKCFPNLNTVL